MAKNESKISKEFALCLDRVMVIGGGRWARVLTETLCMYLPSSVEVSVHSLHNADAMSEWVKLSGFCGRVDVLSEWPQKNPTVSSAVIVVNAANDHEQAVSAMLSADIPVLVEKPMACTATAAQRLVDMACNRNIRFATAHVFLFTKSLHRFSSLISRTRNIQFIRIVWEDPTSENRYGEEKHYDPSLSVFADWLPHISSILNLLVPRASQECYKVEFLEGGAHLELKIRLNDIPCSIQLVRNGEQRQRIIEVSTEEDMFRLNFSKEPGIIMSDSIELNDDSDGKTYMRPVAQMLMAFVKWAAGGEFDSRLDSMIGLQASQLIEQVDVYYREALVPWLIKKVLSQKCEGKDMYYALSEILQSQVAVSKVSIEQQIERVRYAFVGPHGAHWKSELTDSMDPLKLVRTIAVNSEVIT